MKTLKLESLKKMPLLYRIAKLNIAAKGVYYCLIDNKKSKIVL